MRPTYIEDISLANLEHNHCLKVTFKGTTKFALFQAFHNYITFTISQIEQPRALTYFKDKRNISLKEKEQFPWDKLIANATSLGDGEKDIFEKGRKIQGSIFEKLAGLTVLKILEYT